MDEWKRVKIGDVCTLEKGTTGLASASAGDYPLVATGAERKTSREYQFDVKAVCIPLVSSTGHGKKSLNYVHYQEGKFALGTILVAVIPRNEDIISSRYLHLYLQKNKDRVVVPLMKGAANVSLSVKDIANIEIPLPSMTEQGKIINKIYGISDEHSELLNEIDIQFNLLGQVRQSILQEAIEGKLTANWRKQHPDLVSGANHASKLLEKIKSDRERLVKEGKIRKEKHPVHISDEAKPFELPEGWVWCRLVDVCSKIGSGSTPRGSNYSEKGIPFFRSQNIHNDGIVYEDIEFISSDVHNQMKGTAVLAGDLLLNITGGSLGRCTLVPSQFNEGNVSQHVCIIRVIAISSEFIHKLMLSPQFQKRIFQYTTGAGREGLPKYNLEQFIIPLPPLAEQKAIVNRVDTLMRVISELREKVLERKEQSEKLMQAVLREAFAMS